MEQSREDGRSARALARGPRGDAQASDHLSDLEAIAAQSLFSGDVERARAEVAFLAHELALDADGGRRRVTAVELSLAHVQVVALEALLGAMMKKKDAGGARLISRLLLDATKRVALLAAAHAPRSRPTLIVGHADAVSVTSGGLP